MCSKTTDFIIQKMNEMMDHFNVDSPDQVPFPRHCVECDVPIYSLEPEQVLCDKCQEKEEQIETNKNE